MSPGVWGIGGLCGGFCAPRAEGGDPADRIPRGAPGEEPDAERELPPASFGERAQGYQRHGLRGSGALVLLIVVMVVVVDQVCCNRSAVAFADGGGIGVL